jgi:hypothetical protein
VERERVAPLLAAIIDPVSVTPPRRSRLTAQCPAVKVPLDMRRFS